MTGVKRNEANFIGDCRCRMPKPSNLITGNVFELHLTEQLGEKMKRIVLAALSISALASVNALAADLPQRPAYKVPMAAPAPVYNWTGCYVGANIGGAWGNINATDVTTGATVSPRNSGFAGGGQVGCDYQMSQWVFGVRNIFDATSISNGATISDALISGTVNSHLRWF